MAGSRRYSDDQVALFDDVLLRLAAEIELKARAKLAQRLAWVNNAPPRLIRSLAFDEAIDVARPVLSFSPRLSDADLVENAKVKSQDHLYAIGRRSTLSEGITDVLIERGNDRVVRALARNTGAHFSAPGYGKLTDRAIADSVLAFGIVQRGDIPRQYLIKLIETASANVREVLEAANPQAIAAIRETVDEVAGAMHQEAREALARARRRRPRRRTALQDERGYGRECAGARPLAEFREDRGRAGEARPLSARARRTRPDRRRRRHGADPRQGGPLLLGDHQGPSAHVCGQSLDIARPISAPPMRASSG